ncbi:MAG: glucose-1-phosphate adenylyltransferase [Firmicutes bacterium]|nr:glucose-1-phosphate adenylyltransferase [Bacillota bacterium]
MSERKQCVAMLLAGGQGSRLVPLTKSTAKPAVPFGGKYRIIDFPLSNCINSGIDTVGVLTQYQPLELNDYLGRGEPWDMNLKFGGLHILPPYEGAEGAEWFLGTANAIYQNLKFIHRYNPKYVLILSGDHIYKMDYRIMLEEHIRNEADCTISVIDVPLEEASRFGIMTTDRTGRITEFNEKPEHPNSTLASMGVYIFSTDKLTQYLAEDELDPNSDSDFGKNVIPRMLNAGERMFAYLYGGYWKDVGTLDSFWAANMDALGDLPELFLNDPAWRIYYRHGNTHPEFMGPEASLTNSIVGDGGALYGSVSDSVIASEVMIEEDTVISDSVVMANCRIGRGARVEHAILGERVIIEPGAVIGAPLGDGELTVIGPNLTIGEGTVIPPGTTVDSPEDLEAYGKGGR